MLYSVGSKVRLKHTGDAGEITEILPDDMVTVYVYDEDMEIPVFIDDLVSEGSAKMQEYALPKSKAAKPQKPKSITENLKFDDSLEEVESLGLQLAFEPVITVEGLTKHYKIWFINDQFDDFILNFKMLLYGEKKRELNLNIPSLTKTYLGELPFDTLNDNPAFELQKWRVTSSGTSSSAKKTIKIKPKTFFTNIRSIPFVEKPIHWFLVFPIKEKRRIKGEDLRSYTKRNAAPPHSIKKKKPLYYQTHDVNEFATFKSEIDLHIEKLKPNAHGMNAADILHTQMAYFDKFMYDAIRIGVSPVYIIHGIGKGKLKQMITDRLRNNRQVISFKNEYHHKYGWGATEVRF